MKKIVLTSSGLLFPKVRPMVVGELPKEVGLRVAYVGAAAALVKDDSYARQDVAIMKELRWEVDEINLAEVGREDLERRLRASRVVYVQGGNGFYLLKMARESGFMELVKDLVGRGELIYMGKSVGSYLACPTMEVHTWHSDKWRRFGVTNLRAMGLVDFLIQAHYSPEDDRAIRQGMSKSVYPLRLLTNRQFLVVEDDKVELKGLEPEYQWAG